MKALSTKASVVLGRQLAAVFAPVWKAPHSSMAEGQGVHPRKDA